MRKYLNILRRQHRIAL